MKYKLHKYVTSNPFYHYPGFLSVTTPSWNETEVELNQIESDVSDKIFFPFLFV